MAWVRLDDGVPEHPKHLKAGPAACWLWVCGIAYCQRQLSDGFIPESALSLLGVRTDLRSNPRVSQLVRRLVRVGLFEKVAGGYRVHDYHDFNETREQAIERKAVISTQRRQAGLASARARATKPEQTVNGPVQRAFNPIPSHPIPSRSREIHDPVCEVPLDEAFDAFQAAYPKSGRSGGYMVQQGFIAAVGKVGLPALLAALENHTHSEQWTVRKIIPSMQRWLEEQRWLQQLDPPVQDGTDDAAILARIHATDKLLGRL